MKTRSDGVDKIAEKLIMAWEWFKKKIDYALTGNDPEDAEWEAFLDRLVAVRTGKAPSIEARDEWILCSLHQPPTQGTYLTTTAKGKVRTDHWYMSRWGHKGEVVAWRPLPEAWRANE